MSELITLAHGNGGRFTRALVEEIFAQHLANPHLDIEADAAPLPAPASGDLLLTTDGFTVEPLEFPGGSIGSLAVHGTVNDLAVSGADPKYLTLNAFIEEGLAWTQLDRIIADLAAAARAAAVVVVAGDTKVVPRGQGAGLYLATTGLGVRATECRLGMNQIRAGDRIVVSGSVGDHGTAVMLARERFGLRGDLRSDSAAVTRIAQSARELHGVRFMRDPTRGGIATVVHEIAEATGLRVRLKEEQVPIKQPVRAVCEILGFDPYYLACEGRVVAVVAEEQADTLLAAWRALPEAADASICGQIERREEYGLVVLETELGGERLLEELEDDPLPRIC